MQDIGCGSVGAGVKVVDYSVALDCSRRAAEREFNAVLSNDAGRSKSLNIGPGRVQRGSSVPRQDSVLVVIVNRTT
jgi:hypothetical protein